MNLDFRFELGCLVVLFICVLARGEPNESVHPPTHVAFGSDPIEALTAFPALEDLASDPQRVEDFLHHLSLEDLRILAKHLIVEQSKLARFARQAHSQSSIDALTGAFNRSELYRQPFDGRQIAVLVADIDFFKRVNDTLGHPAGDSVIRRFAQTLRENVREAGDQVIRFGGEEFLILLHPVDEEQARGIAERIRVAVESLLFPEIQSQSPLQITTSIGIALGPMKSREDLDQLIKRADTALYRAKNGGRNRVVTFESFAHLPQENPTTPCASLLGMNPVNALAAPPMVLQPVEDN